MPNREVRFTVGEKEHGLRFLAETFMALEAKEKFLVEPTEKIDEYLMSVTGVVKVLRYGLEGYAVARGTGERPTIADAQRIVDALGKATAQTYVVRAIVLALIPAPEEVPGEGESGGAGNPPPPPSAGPGSAAASA